MAGVVLRMSGSMIKWGYGISLETLQKRDKNVWQIMSCGKRNDEGRVVYRGGFTAQKHLQCRKEF